LITPQDKVKMAELINKFYEQIENNPLGAVTLTISAKNGKVTGSGVNVNSGW
jgi:hypothetical protein